VGSVPPLAESPKSEASSTSDAEGTIVGVVLDGSAARNSSLQGLKADPAAEKTTASRQPTRPSGEKPSRSSESRSGSRTHKPAPGREGEAHHPSCTVKGGGETASSAAGAPVPEHADDGGNSSTHGTKGQAPAVVSSSVSVEMQSTAAAVAVAVVDPRRHNGASSRSIDGDGSPRHCGGGGSGGDKLPAIVGRDELEEDDKFDQDEYASDTFESLGELSLTR